MMMTCWMPSQYRMNAIQAYLFAMTQIFFATWHQLEDVGMDGTVATKVTAAFIMGIAQIWLDNFAIVWILNARNLILIVAAI